MLGLVAGLTLPSLALVIRGWLPGLVALILFISALRIGPRAALGLHAIARTASLVLLFQAAMPLIGLGAALVFGVADHPLALVLILMLAAPSITGSPNFIALMGHDPAPPMRLLIFGTAVFPLTVLPILWLLPNLGEPALVIGAAVRLFVVIALAVGAGFTVRYFWQPSPQQIQSIDGLSAITLAILAVGLMSALGPAIRTDLPEVLIWLVAATVANLGLQTIAIYSGLAPGESLIAGNRNIALFLVALPAAVTDPLLIFIGCYQIPMYLTPIVMQRLYAPKE